MRKLLLFLFILILPLSANAATCSAGYYLSGGTCTACQDNHYCPGDDVMYDCPPITYTDAQVKQLVENQGYNVTGNIGRVYLSTGWFNGGAGNTSISQCAMAVLTIPVEQGNLTILGFRYSPSSGNYTSLQMTFWSSANPGYYLRYKHPSSDMWESIQACTNSHPANSHYSGAGTPDVGNCPWECDAGYWNDNGVCTQCPAGYYINNGQCVSCENNHYCTGDGTMHACPAITYTDAQLRQLIEDNGFSGVTDYLDTHLSTGWFNDGSNNINREMCAMVVEYITVAKGTLRILGFRYRESAGNYTSLQMTYWSSANPGYYLRYKHPSSEIWQSVQPCTNSHPANSHYSGPGTPDSADGTIIDANDCPWECDAGFGQHGEYECLPLCEAGVKELHFGDRYVNMYKYKYTSPAIHIENNGVTCYVRLELGESSGLNVHTNGRTFHAVD